MSIGRQASRGATFTIGAQAARLLIQLAGIVILARLLSPTDYGYLTMVVAIIGVAELLRDFGLSFAAIQAKTLSNQQQSNLFFINTGIGAVATLVVAATSPLIAALYGEPRLVPIVLALSVTFLINGVTTQFRAKATRDLRLSALAVTETVAPFTGLIIAIFLALAGGGYWALVAQQIITALATLLGSIYVAKWRPTRYRRNTEIRSLVAFGANIFVSQVVTYASRNIDSVIVGAFFGPAQLGIYNKAFQFLMLPLNQLNAPATRVAMPVLSRLQDDAPGFRRYLLTGQTMLLHLIMIVFAAAWLGADPFVTVILGDQWSGVTEIFRVLAIAGCFQAAGYATYWCFLALGLSGRLLAWSLTTRPIIIGAIVLGAAVGGVPGVAWGYTIATAVMWPLGVIWVSHRSNAPGLAIFTNGLRILLLYGFAAALSEFVRRLSGLDGVPGALLALGTLLGTSALLILAFRSFRSDVRLVLHAVRKGFS
ncbi:lipopolysaccharide biosynthesis protein [Microbacterium sp. A84]|uniref:lipopolysaccharide biosynthesis protein n=1 Tax=Microbacterium sp. A84 TaxID=3450715 RepID=UPI003F433908